MENQDNEFEYFDPAYSEYNPLSEEIRNEMKKLMHPEKKENTGFCASLIRKLMPCNLV